jgi:hypothetical protein
MSANRSGLGHHEDGRNYIPPRKAAARTPNSNLIGLHENWEIWADFMLWIFVGALLPRDQGAWISLQKIRQPLQRLGRFRHLLKRANRFLAKAALWAEKFVDAVCRVVKRTQCPHKLRLNWLNLCVQLGHL